jgi:hypothetical protein
MDFCWKFIYKTKYLIYMLANIGWIFIDFSCCVPVYNIRRTYTKKNHLVFVFVFSSQEEIYNMFISNMHDNMRIKDIYLIPYCARILICWWKTVWKMPDLCVVYRDREKKKKQTLTCFELFLVFINQWMRDLFPEFWWLPFKLLWKF